MDKRFEFNEDEFFDFWNKKAEEIKEWKLDYSEISTIQKQFEDQIISFRSVLNQQKAIEVISNLSISLNKAEANYRESKKGFWVGFLFLIASIFSRTNVTDLMKILEEKVKK